MSSPNNKMDNKEEVNVGKNVGDGLINVENVEEDSLQGQDPDQDPENQQQPPPDQANNIGRLRHGAMSTTSRFYDRGNKGYLDETEELVRSYDKNGDGKIDMTAAMDLAHNARAKERKVQQTRTWAIVATVAAILFALATFGLVWVALILSKEVETDGDNALVSTDSKAIVKTYNHGCVNHFEFIQGLLQDVDNDGEADVLDTEFENGLAIIGEVPMTEVEETYVAISQDFHVCTVMWSVKGIEYARKIDPTNLNRKVDPSTGTVTYDNYLVSDDVMGNFVVAVKCNPGEANCQVYQHQTADDVRRRLVCFSSNSSVMTESKGVINIMDLEVNDRVLSSDGSYSTVYSLGHHSVDQESVALKIETETSTIELSGNHMIYLAGKDLPVMAESIVVGDKLVRVSDDLKSSMSEAVLKISEVDIKGFASPLTVSGDIVVDNIVASSYAVVGNLGSEYYYYHGENSIFNIHSQLMAHVGMTPLRLACTWVSISLCKDEYHNPPEHEDYAGAHFYTTFLLYSVKFGLSAECGFILHAILYAVIVGPCLLLFLVENFLPAFLVCGGTFSLAFAIQKKIKKAGPVTACKKKMKVE